MKLITMYMSTPNARGNLPYTKIFVDEPDKDAMAELGFTTTPEAAEIVEDDDEDSEDDETDIRGRLHVGGHGTQWKHPGNVGWGVPGKIELY